MSVNPIVKLWTLYALGVFFTILRTYARIVAVGIRDLHADDYLIWLAIFIYTAQCSLGYSVGAVAHGLANNGMTDEDRSLLSQDDPEYIWRVIGSKIQLAGWTTAACLLWTLKLCMAFFYLRLTSGVSQYQKRIHIAMSLIAITFFVVIMTIYLSCRPIDHYWQINPDPGNVCQAAVSRPIIWVTFVTNVLTDVFLLLIPIPMLWKSRLILLKKIAATLVLSAGAFIIVCAILKSVYVIVDPAHSGQLAAAWGTRETFVSVMTTNLPMIFPLLKTWCAPIVHNTMFSSRNNKDYKTKDSGFVTIGGSGANASSRNRKGSRGAYLSGAKIIFDNESEEHIVQGDGGVRMDNIRHFEGGQMPSNTIIVSRQISVMTEKSC